MLMPMFSPTEGFAQAFVDNNTVATGATTHTHSSMTFGAAASSRKMVACISWDSASNRTLSSVTIGGVSASRAVRTIAVGDRQNTEIWIADVPTGTSGDVVLTFTSTTTRSRVSLYRTVGLSSSTPTDTAVDDTNSGNVMNVSVNTPSGKSMVFAVHYEGGTGLSVTNVGVTEADDADYDTAAHHSSGSVIATSAATPRTVTGTWSGTPTNERSCAAVFQ